MENRKVRLNQHTNLLELEEHMYPLVDVDTPNVFRICSIMMKSQRLHSMTVLCRIICRMKSGSQIRHLETDSSPELLIQQSRL